MANQDTTWRDALILVPSRIAGLRVRPLSAWHCHVAQMLDVRMGLDDELRGPTPGDIAQTIAICRSVYHPDVAGVKIAGWFLRRVYLPIRWAFHDWRKDARDLVAYVESFRRYPQIIRDGKGESKPLGAPSYFAIALDVASRLPSITLKAALNMPLLSLYCIRAALVELDGGPACAWRTASDPNEVANALAAATEAIAKHNAKAKEAGNGRA